MRRDAEWGLREASCILRYPEHHDAVCGELEPATTAVRKGPAEAALEGPTNSKELVQTEQIDLTVLKYPPRWNQQLTGVPSRRPSLGAALEAPRESNPNLLDPEEAESTAGDETAGALLYP